MKCKQPFPRALASNEIQPFPRELASNEMQTAFAKSISIKCNADNLSQEHQHKMKYRQPLPRALASNEIQPFPRALATNEKQPFPRALASNEMQTAFPKSISIK